MLSDWNPKSVYFVEMDMIDRSSFAVNHEDGLTDQLDPGSLQFPEDANGSFRTSARRGHARKNGKSVTEPTYSETDVRTCIV